jgi:cation:H+ antiporter
MFAALSNSLEHTIDVLARWPVLAIAVFTGATLVLVWALDRMARHGLEGTALGTLAMPYCSGLGNLLFVALVARNGTGGEEVVINSLVNNVTNLTLLLGGPALIWGLTLFPTKRRSNRAVRLSRVNRLSLLSSLAAAGFFAGLLALLASDGRLDRIDGAVLIGLFLFWQCFEVFDVLKAKAQQNRRLSSALLFDAVVLLAAGGLIYVSIEGLLRALESFDTQSFGGHGLGWITGWVMVLPNAVLAVHYARRSQPEIVYSSQLGDGHICIPLCIGLAALIAPMAVPPILGTGLVVLGAALAVHLGVLLALGALPRWLGACLVASYGAFFALGLG